MPCAVCSTLSDTVAEAKGTGNAVALGGGQGGAFGATLDGISVNTNRNANTVETAFLTPSVEAITEFAVETNGFKPEFGQAGGGSITFASKSGTNKLEGSVYNFFRDDSLDEKPYFAATKNIYKQNNFGGSLGGPVVVPGLQRQEQDVLLRLVRGLRQQAERQRNILQRADAGNDERRLLESGRSQRQSAS